MSKYTISIEEIINDFKYNIFDFDYELEVIDKKELEQNFIDKYWLNEICMETYSLWKSRFRFKWQQLLRRYNIIFRNYLKDFDFLYTRLSNVTETTNTDGEMKNTTESNSKGKATNILDTAPITEFIEDGFITEKRTQESENENSSGADTTTNELKLLNRETKQRYKSDFELTTDFIDKLRDVQDEFLESLRTMFITLH